MTAANGTERRFQFASTVELYKHSTTRRKKRRKKIYILPLNHLNKPDSDSIPDCNLDIQALLLAQTPSDTNETHPITHLHHDRRSISGQVGCLPAPRPAGHVLPLETRQNWISRLVLHSTVLHPAHHHWRHGPQRITDGRGSRGSQQHWPLPPDRWHRGRLSRSVSQDRTLKSTPNEGV